MTITITPFSVRQVSLFVGGLITLVAMSIFAIRPTITHAQSSGTFAISSLSNGVFMLGPSGSYSYCSPTQNVVGEGLSTATVTAKGVCFKLGTVSPASDKWVIAPVAGGAAGPTTVVSYDGQGTSFTSNAVLLDETDGNIIQCAILETPGPGGEVWVNANCKQLWTIPK